MTAHDCAVACKTSPFCNLIRMTFTAEGNPYLLLQMKAMQHLPCEKSTFLIQLPLRVLVFIFMEISPAVILVKR